jgi:hypothetical protein
VQGLRTGPGEKRGGLTGGIVDEDADPRAARRNGYETAGAKDEDPGQRDDDGAPDQRRGRARAGGCEPRRIAVEVGLPGVERRGDRPAPGGEDERAGVDLGERGSGGQAERVAKGRTGPLDEPHRHLRRGLARGAADDRGLVMPGDEDPDRRAERHDGFDDGGGSAPPAASHLVLERGAGQRACLLLRRPGLELGHGGPGVAEDEVRARAAIAADGRRGGVDAGRSAARRTGRGEAQAHGRQAFGTARVSRDTRAPADGRATSAVTWPRT